MLLKNQTTPEKYKAMSPSQRRIFDARAREETKAFNKAMEKKRAANNETFIDGILDLVGRYPRIELEIVGRYLDRNNFVLKQADAHTLQARPRAKRGKKSRSG